MTQTRSSSMPLGLAGMLLIGLAGVVSAANTAAQPRPIDDALLARGYFHYLIADQVRAQAPGLVNGRPEATTAEITRSIDEWHSGQLESIRKDLMAGLGDAAQTAFEQFIAGFTDAEASKDTAFLAELTDALDLDPSPDSYPALRKVMLESVLADTMARASRFLSEIQTWTDLKARGQDVPPLELWLARSGGPQGQRGTARSAPRPKKPALADAEADAGAVPEDIAEGGASSPLDNFAALRQSRREQALKEAEAGMQQVAAERQAAEEEYATKKLAAAQADAENMKRQAEKMAATEKDALEQRKNSWGNRLKAIVGATVSATTGAFTGAIGARAADEAVNAIFSPR